MSACHRMYLLLPPLLPASTTGLGIAAAALQSAGAGRCDTLAPNEYSYACADCKALGGNTGHTTRADQEEPVCKLCHGDEHKWSNVGRRTS